MKYCSLLSASAINTVSFAYLMSLSVCPLIINLGSSSSSFWIISQDFLNKCDEKTYSYLRPDDEKACGYLRLILLSYNIEHESKRFAGSFLLLVVVVVLLTLVFFCLLCAFRTSAIMALHYFLSVGDFSNVCLFRYSLKSLFYNSCCSPLQRQIRYTIPIEQLHYLHILLVTSKFIFLKLRFSHVQ